MAIITTQQLKDLNVIAELNQKLAKKKIIFFYVKNNEYTTVSLIASNFEKLRLTKEETFLSIANVNPYMHIMIFYYDFTHIEITEVD